MCGIAGVFGLAETDILTEMLERLRHRGPDDEGRLIREDIPMMMGMRRLAIVDLAGGAQPIRNEDGTVHVVFNGEIYNHSDLRAELESQGHRFSTNADTEVLVHLWEEYGVRTPEHLNGMFSFVIWDDDQESLFLARDRLGIKPLYYTTDVGQIAFASELPALLTTGINRTIDERAVYNYFSLQYTPWPQTLLEEVRKLQPGTSLLIVDGEITKRSFWSINRGSPVKGSEAEVASGIREKLARSVERRFMADVPVGAFLSGGLDSSTVVGLMSELKEKPIATFSVAFAGETDESEEARFVAEHFGTDHHEIMVDLDESDVIGELVAHFGEPLADPAILPTMLVSRFASEHVKVVQTGSGADEIFGGYWMHRTIPRHRRWFGHLPKPVYRQLSKATGYLPSIDPYLRYASSLSDDVTAIEHAAKHFTPPPPERYLDSGIDSDSSGLRSMITDSIEGEQGNTTYDAFVSFYLSHWLPDDILFKVDHTTMASSLEARVPFLDHELVDYLVNVPRRYVVKSGEYKPLLKRAVDDLVPDRTLKRSKQGFGIQLDEWLRSDRDAITKWLSPEKISVTPFLDGAEIESMWTSHRRERRNHGTTLWKVLNYVAWYHYFAK